MFLTVARWPTHEHKEMRIKNYWKANSIAAKLIADIKKEAISFMPKFEFSENKDLLRLHVYFLDLNYEIIEEEPEYEWTALMADFGGILGKIVL